MKKKIRLITLLLVVSALMFSAAACGDNNGDNGGNTPEPPPALLEIPGIPGEEGLSVDVTEKPSGFSLGGKTLSKVIIDETELSADDYIVSGDRFIFACEYYGEMGLGTHTVKMQLGSTEQSFPIKVVDRKSPYYSFSLAETLTFGETDAITFPVVERHNAYQVYDVTYVVAKGGTEIYNEKNVESTAEFISFAAGELGLGSYTFTVKIRQSGITIQEYVCNFSVVKYSNDIFSGESASGWGAVSTAVVVNHDGSGTTFTTTRSDGLRGRYFVAYYSLDFMRQAKLKGCAEFSFEVKVNATMAAASDALSSNAKFENGGIRIYGKVNDGLCGGGIEDGNEGNGIYVYGDYTMKNGTLSTEWKTVTINIDEFLNMSPDIKYFAIVVAGAENAESPNNIVYLRNAVFA